MTGLIADIGATNARFALTTPDGGWRDEKTFPCAAFPSFVAAARAYLDQVLRPGDVAPSRGAVCMPGPVEGDRVTLTNLEAWSFSIQEVGAALGLEALSVVNDFVANALAVPHLDARHVVAITDAAPCPFPAPVAVVGPGSGLGVSLLLPGGQEALATEGGHVSLAAVGEREAVLLEALAQRHGHVSAERAVSGPGLVNLADAIRRVEGIDPVPAETPAQVLADGVAGVCPVRAEAVALFFSFLGTVAGNVVLTTGAWGGLWLMGGVLPRCVAALQASGFWARFTQKGRFQARLEQVPVFLVRHPYPAFVGLGGLVDPAGRRVLRG